MQQTNRLKSSLWLPVLAAALLCGCARYHPLPLDLAAHPARQIPHLHVDPARLGLARPGPYRFDPEDGLDDTEAAMLAVANNPELKLARDEAGVAHAQAFATGLLPDPQLSAGLDFPHGAPAGSNFTGYNLGLDYDLNALLTRDVARASAAATARQADLNLLWQEWQVASQARLLWARSREQQRLLRLLQQERQLLSTRYDHVRQALREGNTTLDAASTDLAALQEVSGRISDLQRRISRTHHQFTRLLGLAPEVTLQLTGPLDLSPLEPQRVRKELRQLPQRRPDLLALQAGYRSQDLRYRQAILEQFPALSVGVTRARDTSNVNTLGVGITLNIPLFNRNRGQIAVEKASRQQLHDEFESRLLAARSTIEEILADQQLLEKQLAAVSAALPELRRAADSAGQALQAGNIDETAYLALRTALSDKAVEQLKLEQDAIEQRIGLQALLGGPVPLQPTDPERNQP